MSYLKQNIEAVSTSLNKEYIKQIESATVLDWTETINSQDDTPNLLVTTGNKRRPIYNIKGWAEDISSRIKNMEFSPSQATLCIGIGLGYFLSEAVKIADKGHKFIVIETEPYMIRLAFEHCDLSEAIINRQVIITPAIEDISFALEYLNEQHSYDDWLVMVEAYTLSHPSYEQTAVKAMSVLNQIRCNIGTVTGAGSTIADNDISNLPYIIHRRGVSELEGLYKGQPAVLVSTGPSLNKNLWRLIDMQDKIIIIAVGQALRPLLSYGITPDFICSVDFGEVNMTHYDGLMDSDVPLIALNRSYAPLLKKWQGPMFVAASSVLSTHPDRDRRVHKILTDKGETLQGGSVAHMCLGVGLLLGCDPIIMIGQDLAYDGDQSHFQQADSTGTLEQGPGGDLQWKVQDPRCHLHGSSYTMGPPISVPGYYMYQVITNSGLASFISSFEQFIKIFTETKIINATEGGAHIQGAIRMSLKKALKKYASSTKVDKSKEKLKPLLSYVDNAMELINKAIPLLQDEINILQQLIKESRLGYDANIKVSKIRNRNWKNRNENKTQKFKKLLAQNQKHSNLAHELAVKLPLVQLAIYGANRKIQHSEMTADGAKYEHMENSLRDARIRIKRNRIILLAVNKAANSLKESYTATIKILKQCVKQNDLRVLTPRGKRYVPDISDAEVYFTVGNFARPMLDAKRILKELPTYMPALEVLEKAQMICENDIAKAKELPDRTNEIDYTELITQGQKIGREEKDYTQAIQIFEQALKIYPKGDLGRWGLATAYMQVKQYDKSIAEYLKIIDRNPKIYRYRFELGQVMICKGDIINGLKHINFAMKETEEFDSFLYVVGDLLNQTGKPNEAAQTYTLYLDKFPGDYRVWKKLEILGREIKDSEIESRATKMYNSLKPKEVKDEVVKK